MKITVNTQKQTAPLGDLYGLFFEDINHAADGGLYAELVRNRSFEFCNVDNRNYDHMTAWSTVIPDGARGKTDIHAEHPFSAKNPHYLVMDLYSGESISVINEGYNGIPLTAGATYDFSCFVACDGREAELEVTLESKDGEIYAKDSFGVSNTEWTQISGVLTSSKTDYDARLRLCLKSCSRLYADMVSLFPQDTFKGRKNGLRKDIAQILADMKPRFMRFPGGCLIHDGSLNANDRDSMYRWKNTIGDVTQRPSRRSNWGYNQTLGLGYYEYFVFCEDIGAKPLPVLAGGYDPHHRRAVAIENLQEWIDDALDLIEFANGDINTEWGKIRAELGHPEPFGLEYIGIGNEEVGAEFFERYPYFHKQIKEKYPDIKIINTAGPFVSGGEYERGWNSANEHGSDLIDEHYYLAPEWFIANHHHYDNYKGRKTKVFLGEYASWDNTWYNALAEASYMIGLERNAEGVALACYAPMLANVGYVNWRPDMVWFDNHRVFGSANYYVQKLFMTNQGDTGLEVKVDTDIKNEQLPSTFGNKIYLAPRGNAVMECTDIEIITEKGAIKCPDVIVSAENPHTYLADAEGDYTIRMKAVRKSGNVGFFIQFDYADDKNKRMIDFGGWENQDSAICEDINGRGSCLDQSRFSLETGKVYEIEVKVENGIITHSVNGTVMNKINGTNIVIEPIYCASSIDETTGDIIVKTVNLKEIPHDTQIVIEDKTVAEAAVQTMYGWDDEARNSFEEPMLVSPKDDTAIVENGVISYTIPPRSICVFRIKA